MLGLGLDGLDLLAQQRGVLGEADLGLGPDASLGLGGLALGPGAVGLDELDPLSGLPQRLRRLVALGQQLALALVGLVADLPLDLAPDLVALVTDPLRRLLAGAGLARARRRGARLGLLQSALHLLEGLGGFAALALEVILERQDLVGRPLLGRSAGRLDRMLHALVALAVGRRVGLLLGGLG